MKKFLCLFLSVVMILSLCFAMVGCTTEDTDDVRGDVVKNDEEKEPAKDKKPTETTNPTETTTPTQQKTEPEFALGQCAMVQNGNWAWGQIKNVKGNTVKPENIKYLPIYMGFENEKLSFKSL